MPKRFQSGHGTSLPREYDHPTSAVADIASGKIPLGMPDSGSLLKHGFSPFVFLLLMVGSMIIWGGSWVSAKLIADRFPPDVLCFWRFLLSSVAFLPFLGMQRRPVMWSLGGVFFCAGGALALSGYMMLFFRGLEHGYAGAGGVLTTSLMPLMTLLLSIVLLGRKARRRDWTGILIGIAGASVIMRVWSLDADLLVKSGNVLFVVCSFVWALVTIFGQKASATLSPMVFSCLAYGLAALCFLPSASMHGICDVFQQDLTFWGNLFFLSVISGSGATTVYFFAAEHIGSYRSSSFAFLVPSSALFLSWLFLGEIPHPATLVGGAVSISAVYLINRPAS